MFHVEEIGVEIGALLRTVSGIAAMFVNQTRQKAEISAHLINRGFRVDREIERRPFDATKDTIVDRVTLCAEMSMKGSLAVCH